MIEVPKHHFRLVYSGALSYQSNYEAMKFLSKSNLANDSSKRTSGNYANHRAL